MSANRVTARYLHLSPSATTDAMQLLVENVEQTPPPPTSAPDGDASVETPAVAENGEAHKVGPFPKGGRRASKAAKSADLGDAAAK